MQYFGRYVVTATRNYQAKVQALMQEVVRHPSNPLSGKHYSAKLEFQGRGAAHNHGTLWLDIEKIEQKVDVQQLEGESVDTRRLDQRLKDPAQVEEKLSQLLRQYDISEEEPKLGGA